MKPNLIILIATILAGVALFFQNQQHQASQAELRQQINQLMKKNQRVDKNSRKSNDPYLEKQVKNTIIKRQRELQVCFNEHLAVVKIKKSGKVVLDWQINPQGNPSKPEVVFAEFEEKGLGLCLTQKIAQWTFPPVPFGESKYVEHTFRFTYNPPPSSE